MMVPAIASRKDAVDTEVIKSQVQNSANGFFGKALA
jgi:hypothetical protein